MSEFKLCKQAGLRVYKNATWTAPDGITGFTNDMVHAGDVEKLLESAPVVCAKENNNILDVTGNPLPFLQRVSVWAQAKNNMTDETPDWWPPTHSARLIIIEPLVKESEERQLLRALVTSDMSTQIGWANYHEAYDKAKRLLDGEK